MSRTSQIHRTTGETDVQLSLDLDGTGAGERATGVGFFDHLLDAVARHGALDLDVRVRETSRPGPHHTVEDTGIALGQALDEALGDRAGIRRFGHAVVPMDEARASAAIDISGRPFMALEGASPARSASATSTPTWPRSSSARWPTRRSSRCTCACEAGTNAHHMVEASFKAFARALRAAVEIDPSAWTGRALDQGRPLTRIAILDYGMGNLRSVGKALEHVGARPVLTSDHARVRAADGDRAARRGRDAEGDGARARPRARPSSCASGSRPPCP